MGSILVVRSRQELDRLVAENLAGWDNLGLSTSTEFFDSGTEAVYEWNWFGKNRLGEQYEPVPKYSASVEAAWKLIDRLRSKGWYVEILNLSDYWVCKLFHYQQTAAHMAEHASIEIAVCLCALKTADIEVAVEF